MLHTLDGQCVGGCLESCLESCFKDRVMVYMTACSHSCSLSGVRTAKMSDEQKPMKTIEV